MFILNDFTKTYDTNQKAIFRYCMWNCRDLEIGQELMQETFLRYWLCLKRNETIRHDKAFLYRIAHNLIIDHVRRKKEASLDELMETGYEPAVDTWHQTYSQLDAERLLTSLEKKQSCYRKALHQRFILGLEPAEIATLNGETANTVSVRIYRGIRQLKLLTNTQAKGKMRQGTRA